MTIIERQIFFDLLHEARRLKKTGWQRLSRRAYLFGMIRHYFLHREELNIAENMKDYWKCQRSEV